MTGLEFHTRDLTLDEADVIADAYFRASKDPMEMARHLGIESFDLNLLMHPLVKRKIVEKQKHLNQYYSLEEHLTMIKQIRDGCITDENWKVALASEIALGKAAGLYEKRLTADTDPDKDVDPETLSTDEIRRRLQAPQKALPSPEEI